MDKRQKKFFFFLTLAHIYCLIMCWFGGDNKLSYPNQYFFHFLSWWCTWSSLLTLVFVFWKLSKPKVNTFFAQVFAFVTMTSNLISMAIYGTGLVIWLCTTLTTYWGFTSRTIKWIPIPSHNISQLEASKQLAQIIKVVRWWFYSPLWHLVLPTWFITWFFRHASKNYLKKRLKLTILVSFIMPTAYFLYCYFRSRLGDKDYFKTFNARWPYDFLSSKTMMKKLLNTNGFRFVWKIILVLFWFSLFGAIVYFSLWIDKKLKRHESYVVLQKKKKKNNLFYRVKKLEH